MVTQLDLGLEPEGWLHLSPEAGGRLSEGVDERQGPGRQQHQGSLALAPVQHLVLCLVEAWICNSSAPPVSPPGQHAGPPVITKESAAESELRVALVQGPGIPSLLGMLFWNSAVSTLRIRLGWLAGKRRVMWGEVPIILATPTEAVLDQPPQLPSSWHASINMLHQV